MKKLLLTVIIFSALTSIWGQTAPAKAAYDRGLKLLEEEKYDAAIEAFTEAIRLDSGFANAYYNRADTYFYNDDYDKALADINQFIKLEPNNPVGYSGRGMVYYAKNDYDRAIEDFSQAIKLDPNKAENYSNRGTMYGFKGDYDKAIADFNQSIKLKPDFLYAYVARGMAYEEKKDFARAKTDYETVLRLDPYNTTAQEKLDILKLKSNQTASPLSQYLVPVTNNLLRGSIENFYKASDEGLIDPVLWVKLEKAQLILSKVKVVSINSYKNIPLQQVITVKDIEGKNAREYSFFYFDTSNGSSDNTFVGDEIFIVWTQGVRILSDNSNNLVFLNRNDHAGTKGFDCFIDTNLWRVVMMMGHNEERFKTFYFNWN